jgi:GR25 family glycosyltransferase involved in LPS biosynthesis
MKYSKKTICLNMIVKNESHVIINTLKNILSNIKLDYWVISDTGSTDNTKELIIQFFKEQNIPGELVEHEWRDFGYNRTKALECAYNKTDYIFIFDADDSIIGKLQLPNEMNADKYDLKFGCGFTYIRPLIINNRKKWIYKGVLHEYLTCDNIESSVHIDGDYYIESGKTGDRSKDPEKYFKDANILKTAFENEIQNDYGLACRYAFYCANSYKDAGPKYVDSAIEWYLKCLELNNWTQEKFMSCINLGNLYDTKKDLNNAYKYWIKSIEYDNERVEGIILACSKMRENGLNNLVNLLYKKYGNYKKDLKNKLFLYDYLYKDQFEFENSVCAFYTDDLLSGYECCKKILINQLLNYDLLKLTLKNLFFYKMFLEKDTDTLLLLFNKIHQLITHIQKREPLDSKYTDIWKILFNKNRKTFTNFKKFNHTNNNKPTFFLSFTTCKRFDLFKQTINSILNNWLDIDKVDYWFCVDDNSSETDREYMKKLYGWIDYYMKNENEKGHQKSMNIIWNKLNVLKPTYWIHMEDDFLFFDKMNYIEHAIKGLELLKSDNVKQIVFNINYAETIDNYAIRGDINKHNGFAIHDHKYGDFKYSNCHYWPHYSFRPSLVCVDTILKLGDYTYDNNFFEMNYAKKWYNNGYRTGFFEKITHIHTGRLTSERNNPDILNAYQLNSETQFDNITLKIEDIVEEEVKKEKTIMYDIKVLNLERRQDRRKEIETILNKGKITKYEIVNSVDGNKLTPTNELMNLFKGNDFQSRCGVIGCALTHYNLWKQLIEDTTYDYYVVMEDDTNISSNFQNQINDLKNVFNEKDLVFLGYHMYDNHRELFKDKYEVLHEDIKIENLNKPIYVGGSFSYTINKNGANKLVKYIQKNGIKHGIDYLMKICDDLDSYETQPQLSISKWVDTIDSKVDSDIQLNFEVLDFSEFENKLLDDKYTFIKGVDQADNDLYYHGNRNNLEYINISEKDKLSVGFNTLGFFKKFIDINKLVKSPYFREEDGTFVKKSYYDLSIQANKTANLLYSHTKEIINISNEKEVYCFIHSCNLHNSGTKILDYIVSYIEHNDLINILTKIFVINIGETIPENYFSNSKIVIINLSNNINLAENSTINMIHSFCEMKPNCQILYLHTKGVTQYNTFMYKYIYDWVNLMLYFLIDNSKSCLEILDNYDTVGCNYQIKPNPHFSGNFWWANSNYINTLNKINYIYDDSLFHVLRHQSESWILSSNYVKYYCLYDSVIDHYQNYYPKENYVNHIIDINKKEVVDINKKYRVKLLCNWTSSEQICKDWSEMCEHDFKWQNIEITWENEHIDYYVIINYPMNNDYYEPSKTILFQMEPWVNDETKNWGVKTWGKWAEPDETQFLSVNGRKQNTHNNVFWHLGMNLNQIRKIRFPKFNKISSICSSKYYDPGHITRINFLKFIESKNELNIDIFNSDNAFNFKGYKGCVTPHKDKYKGIVNYKYYFMVENNYEENFITEKLWEPILCETLVFYYGCPNVSTYINPLAYVELDINDFEKCYQTIKKAIYEDLWSQRIDIIRQEKERILNDLAFFPRIQKIIQNNEMKKTVKPAQNQ